MKNKLLTGRLDLFSEQGMEGGRLSIMDEKFIKLNTPRFGLQSDRKVYDLIDTTKSGVTSNPESHIDNSWVPTKGSIPAAEHSRVTVKWDDNTIDTERLSSTLLVEEWSYEGLHMIEESDFLKIKDPKTGVIICENQISSIPLNLSSQTMKGHFENINGDDNWEKYFVENYFAELYRTT
jgi:hypothetical protein